MNGTVPALVAGDELRSPAPGWFHLLVAQDHAISPGDVIGELEILGRVVRVTATGVHGRVKLVAGPVLARRPVGYAGVLLEVVRGAALPDSIAEPADARTAASGLVFRAPTSGRYYGRPAPDKPPFLAPGAELSSGTTVCLLEVMKTFHRVHYGGADVPARARVRALLVADGADVNAGDPLLALEAIS